MWVPGSLSCIYRIQGTQSLLTGIGRVGCRAVEEGGGAAQVGHGCCAVPIHARGHRAIVGLLGRGAGHVTMRRHAAGIAGETWRVL